MCVIVAYCRRRGFALDDEYFRKMALKLAKKAYKKDETPIGCVIVKDEKVIGKGYNKRNRKKDSLAHAEIIAIRQACRRIRDWRLEDCTLYVTIEPCPMCAGAIIQARIPLVVMGADNPKAGCAGSVTDLFNMDGFNHRPEVKKGILREDCSTLMSSFFRELRKR